MDLQRRPTRADGTPMGVVVKLADIVDAMDMPQEWQSFIDPATGEIVSITEEQRFTLEHEGDDAEIDMPEWEQESITRIRRVLESGRALALPDSFDIHEWELMRRFIQSVEDLEARAELWRVIHGTGAFRLFKVTTSRLGLREQWFAFRDGAIRDLAREWLEENGIAYVEDIS